MTHANQTAEIRRLYKKYMQDKTFVFDDYKAVERIVYEVKDDTTDPLLITLCKVWISSSDKGCVKSMNNRYVAVLAVISEVI